jgi:hypothetical protein
MRLFVTVILIAICSIKLQAQQDSAKKITLTLAALYNSNISYYGQVTTEKMPYVLANATLRLPMGLYFSAGAYQLFNYGNGLSEADLGIGYEHEFNEKISIGIAYTRSFFPANSPLLQASNENNLNASITYIWPWLTTEFNADYAFGKQQDVFLSLNNSKEIELGTLFNDKNFLTFTPGVEIVAGTRHFYETYIAEKIKRNQGRGKGASKISTVETSLVPTNSFNLLAYNFKLPITLSRAKYMAEVSYQFSILGAKENAEVKTNQSFFGLAFYYQF